MTVDPFEYPKAVGEPVKVLVAISHGSEDFEYPEVFSDEESAAEFFGSLGFVHFKPGLMKYENSQEIYVELIWATILDTSKHETDKARQLELISKKWVGL